MYYTKMLEIDDTMDHVNLFIAYKELMSAIKHGAESHRNDCIKGTFIDPSLGVVAQNYINTVDKFGNHIYPLDFTQGNNILHMKILNINFVNIYGK